MYMRRKIYKTAFVLFMLVFLCSCFNLTVVKNVKNPDKYFRKAYRQIEQIHKRYPRRDGRAHTLHVWVYDGKDRKLVQASAPLLFVNHIMDSEMDAFKNKVDYLAGQLQAWREAQSTEEKKEIKIVYPEVSGAPPLEINAPAPPPATSPTTRKEEISMIKRLSSKP